MTNYNFTPYGPGLSPTDISQVSNDNFYRVQTALTEMSGSDGWISNALPSVSSVTNNGNRSYDITFDRDISTVLSPGMRLKTVRQVAAPTQCTSLNGSTQYWSDSTVSGFTATDDVTFMAWIYLTSYLTTSQDIIGRGALASSGCGINLQSSTGALQVFGFAAGPTYRIFTANQAVPLNKSVHVAATLNMSAGTYKIYMDGVEVPGTLGSSGTPSAFVNTGDLWVGRRQSGTTYFNGKISQAAIFSSVLSEATIRQYMTQGLTGTESTLVSAWSFDGNANDLNTSNANNLTASGSAVATNADSPFSVNGSGTPTGTDDLALVQKVSTTVATVQVPAGCTIPTSGGIAATYISTVKNPLNWISDSSKWTVESLNRVNTAQTSPTASTWYNINSFRILIPVGSWQVTSQIYSAADKSTATIIVLANTLSTVSNNETDNEFTVLNQIQGASGTLEVNNTALRIKNINLTAATTYYSNVITLTASVFALYLRSVSKISVLPSGL